MFSFMALPEVRNEHVAHRNFARTVRNGVHTKEHLVFRAPECRKRRERLLSHGACLLIDSRCDASCASFDKTEFEVLTPEHSPAVLAERAAAAHDDVRSKTIHRQRCGPTSVERFQRFFGSDQQGKCVCKADMVVGTPKLRVDAAYRTFGDTHEAY